MIEYELTEDGVELYFEGTYDVIDLTDAEIDELIEVLKAVKFLKE